MFPRGGATALRRQQRPESGLAAEAGALPAQGGEGQRGQEHHHAPPHGGVEERLSIECTGSNPQEIWCVSPGPPGWRPVGRLTTGLGAPGGSAEGGVEEL